ncbi:MAG: hypothetical protein GY699_23170 [Desulfobacteraceae bacterium]|nr:hypothetical protein [Desulfobacteraceae bacterium]
MVDEKYNNSLLILWSKLKRNKLPISDHSIKYLQWRFSKRVIKNLTMFSTKSKHPNSIIGNLIFSIKNKKVRILDIVSGSTLVSIKLIIRLIQISFKNKVHGIYITLSSTTDLYKLLRLMGFININEKAEVFYYGDTKMLKNGWHFFYFDRNLQ